MRRNDGTFDKLEKTWIDGENAVTQSYLADTPREAIKAIGDAGGEVIAAASIVDRSAGAVDLGVPFFPLIELNFPTYAPDELPPELAGSEAVKPGSRKA